MPYQSLQSETINLSSANKLLGNALLKITEMCGRFGELVAETLRFLKVGENHKGFNRIGLGR